MTKKIRYDLIPAHGLLEVSKVLTSKLEKYETNQWKYGLPWMENVVSTMKKHLTEFELGHDFTEEGNLHMAEVANQALIICEYYSIFPQGDDRTVAPVNKPIVGLDIDNVCADFNTAYEKRFGIEMNPYWASNYKMPDHLKELENDKDFWINIPVLHKPSFEVDYYITARNIPVEWTQEFLEKNGFPCAPVHTVGWDKSKVDLIKSLGITLMIDDKYQNYKEITEAGIFCYLMDAPHNQYYNVGHRRIFNLDKPLK